MLLNRGQAKLHLLFAIPAAGLTAVCTLLYVRACISAGTLVGGGSGAGLICGIVAGLIIVFEMLLWPRKAFRRLRLIPAKYWLAGHIWFGLASLPLAILHSGFHLGGWLPATFIILFVLTIISGIYGVIIQNILPKWMLRNLPSETIYNQIDYVSEQAVEDIEKMLVTACGRPFSDEEVLEEEPELEAAQIDTIVVGAVRQSGKTRGRTLRTRKVADASEDRETLWSALEEIRPFLMEGRVADTPVTHRPHAVGWFGRLRNVCGEDSRAIVDEIEVMCDQRRQFDSQQVVHRWLHAWIPIHIGLSVAVTVLLAAHVWTALKYW